MAMEVKVGLVGVGSIYFCGLSTPPPVLSLFQNLHIYDRPVL